MGKQPAPDKNKEKEKEKKQTKQTKQNKVWNLFCKINFVNYADF